MTPASPDQHELHHKILGYLNFSSGAPDPQFLEAINWFFGPQTVTRDRGVEQPDTSDVSPYDSLVRQLTASLERLRSENPAFENSEQARRVIELVFDDVLPSYHKFHRDLLFHHSTKSLYRSFFIGRIMEAVLQQGAPWDDVQRITAGAIGRLNDFVGHRPVAVLESRKLEPYVREWVRPFPLFIRGAGIEMGRYHELVSRAMAILRRADDDVLRVAHFDLDHLEELAVDPRACDFEHPAGKRPNYLFGQWDPHQISGDGYYTRFVLREITLDSLMHRVENPGDLSADELLTEAAAVLAGTILMASGISGRGPGAHESTVTLGNLLPRIALYRDRFYEQTLKGIHHDHGERLEVEAALRQQPFGGARQDLNARLAGQRALQIQHVYLARIFGRMGFPQAAARQTEIVPVASARLGCQIECHLVESDRCLARGEISEALEGVSRSVALLHRAIECGAMIDPWNILGFDANYSLFPAPENSIRDIRADELIETMEHVFGIFGQLWSEAAARDDRNLNERISAECRQLADWWHQFAVHEVSSVEAFNAQDACGAAERAADALTLWHRGGNAAGDIGFWKPRVEGFESAEAFSMVVRALLARGDLVTSMFLLVYWLGQANRVGLERADASFHGIALNWMRHLTRTVPDVEQRWESMRKFFDYLEANAQEYWQVPEFQLNVDTIVHSSSGFEDEEEPIGLEDEEQDLFGAAYEEVVYRDSTDDGMEGSIFDEDFTTEFELDEQSRRLADRLSFLTCIAELWKLACWSNDLKNSATNQLETLHRWLDQALVFRHDLQDLISSVHRYTIPTPAPTQESMLQYDRHRLLKETVLEKATSTLVAMCDATRFIVALLITVDEAATLAAKNVSRLDATEIQAARILAAIMNGDRLRVEASWDEFLATFANKTLLYVPLSRRGDPRKIVRARLRQRIIEDLMGWLPRIGCLKQTCELIDTARQMEQNHPSGGAAVTEFDTLFESGFRALVRAVIESSRTWQSDDKEQANLVDCLEPLTQSMLGNWLAHSRTLRLSVLERVSEEDDWQELVEFIQAYGGDLFTQSFLGLANVRAILHQGVADWLDLLDENDNEEGLKIVDDLERQVSHESATEHLTLILESIIENYGEYRDYNSTTTQSDRGDLLYMLLDFLRLRVEYDRVAWNLKPVVLAHDVLVKHQRNADAELWRRALVERTEERAAAFLDRLAQLQHDHAMKMPTIADRISGQFIRPMIIDRLTALVEPAMREAQDPGPHTAFDLLKHEALALAHEPSGVGLDVPDWLVAIEDEVERFAQNDENDTLNQETDFPVPHVQVSFEDVQQQLNDWNPE